MEIKGPDENKLALSRLLKHFCIFNPFLDVNSCTLSELYVGAVDMFCSFAPGLRKKVYSFFQLYIYIHKRN